jgi:hypothetical protein
MNTGTLAVLVSSVIVILGIGVFVIVNLLSKNKRLESLLLSQGVVVLELEKEKIRTLAEEQRIKTQTAKSNAEAAARGNEIKKKDTVIQATQTIDSEIEHEKKLNQLLVEKRKNTAAEIQEREAKIKAGINPNPVVPPVPKTRFEKFSEGIQKHWFFSFVALIILIIILHKLNII